MTSLQPTTVGGYEIFAELGRGGLGVVYQARDTRLQRDVALKLIHPQWLADPASVERFLRAVRAAARLGSSMGALSRKAERGAEGGSADTRR